MSKKQIYFDIELKSTDRQPFTFKARQQVMTNDIRAAELVFRITDLNPTELAGAVPSVLLFMKDGSFFQTSTGVTMEHNTFKYTLKPEEIKHQGVTQVQLVVKIGTVENASPLCEFEIVGGLETKPITQVMIQDWTTLTAEAKAFVEQIEGFTLEQFIENQMGQELANLEINYATRLTGLEQKDVSLTAQLEQTETELNARVSETIANAGDGTLPTEVVDMRNVGGKTYTVAGDALRAISDGEGLKDGAVTIKKTEYFDSIQKNYVNPETLNRGYLVSHAYGGLVVFAGYNTSDFVPVSEGDAIYSNSKLNYALFNAEKVFVSGKEGNSYTLPIIIPSGVSFIQQSFAAAETMPVISKGSLKLVPYDDVEVAIGNESVKKAILDVVSGDIEQKSPLKTIASVMSSIVLSDRKMNIKLLGDSITAGVGGTGYSLDGEVIYSTTLSNPNGHCWANSLGGYLESKYNCSVKNYGVSGLTSWALESIMHLAIRPEDDIIICMIGTNDRTNTQAELYRNIKDVELYVKSLGKEIIFMSCIPASIAGEEGKAFHMEDVDSVIMKASSDLNQEYISLYKLFIEYCYSRDLSIDSFLADGLHPNDAGYDVMFYLVCQALGIGQKRVGATW